MGYKALLNLPFQPLSHPVKSCAFEKSSRYFLLMLRWLLSCYNCSNGGFSYVIVAAIIFKPNPKQSKLPVQRFLLTYNSINFLQKLSVWVHMRWALKNDLPSLLFTSRATGRLQWPRCGNMSVSVLLLACFLIFFAHSSVCVTPFIQCFQTILTCTDAGNWYICDILFMIFSCNFTACHLLNILFLQFISPSKCWSNLEPVPHKWIFH